jgi:hypothetical protein
MNFLKKIGGFFVRAKNAVAAALVAAFGSDAAQKIEDSVVAVLRTELGKITLAVVAELMNYQNLSGAQKAEEAFNRILVQAKASGLSAKDHLIKFAIEAAVLALKNGLAKLQ